MLKKRIGIIGLGTVGKSFLSQLYRSRGYLKKNVELDIEVAKICDTNPAAKKLASSFGIPFTKKAREVIGNPKIDILVELVGGIHPAKEYIISALKKGKDIVTANKALLANCGSQLFSIAYKKSRTIKFEAAVAGGIPLIKSVSEILRFGKIKNIYGILNGTTNFILSQMSNYDQSFAQALKEAKGKGITEKDASLDIRGIDSFYKISLLCFLCFGRFAKLSSSNVSGINKISLQDILYAKELGFAIKLLSIAKKDKKLIEVRVHPTLIPQKHPLSKTDGVLNAIYIHTEESGNFLFSGHGAGGRPTSLAVLGDVLSICNQQKPWILKEDKRSAAFKRQGDLISRYYLRFQAKDQPGVLAKISKVLADVGISIASVTQKEKNLSSSKSKFVPIVMLTHKASKLHITKAIERIDKLSIIKPSTQIIPIENL